MSDSYIEMRSDNALNKICDKFVKCEAEIAELEAIIEGYKNKTFKLFWLFDVSTYDPFDHVKESWRRADLKDMHARLEVLMSMAMNSDTIYLSVRDYTLIK